MSPEQGLKVRRFGQLQWSVRADWPITWWREVLADPEAWLRDRACHFKNSSNVTVARVPSPTPLFPGLVLRRINYGRLRQRFRDLFRRSRAQRALRRALDLEAAGVPVAAGVAAADVRCWRWPLRAYVLSLEVRPGHTLNQVVRENGSVPTRLQATLGRLLGRLHAAGFTHGDLKATNILLDDNGEPTFIDFDGVRQFAAVPREWAVRDLARLANGIVQAGGRLSPWAAGRFLAAYCAVRPGAAWREWFQAVRPRVRTRTAAEGKARRG